MRDKDNWKPTRVIKTRNSFIINPEHVGSGSRYIFDLQLKKYIELLNKYSNGILLDCGCGNVPYYEIYKEKPQKTFVQTGRKVTTRIHILMFFLI